ncbi:hypothetical protein K435DRAFT_891202 [Dendrothele bispora CBS 962.96]|uniref:Uncharacterized protein n=1 Tax=Dendrothele bispora (strain CBS 962.96) TaxID=1314807 RepID=A0A4S8M3W7_DENBC|nr:hypothetical protein K435DRAFT_891202 [Dendrothele bispora CBS 962.96]
MSQALPLQVSENISSVPQTFAEIYGTALITSWTLSALYGISALQTYMYFFKYPSDNLYLKFYIDAHGQSELMLEGYWSLYAGHLLGVQISYVFLYKLANGIWRTIFASIFILLSCYELGIAFYFDIKVFQLWEILEVQKIVKTVITPMMVPRVAVDLLICGYLSIILHESRAEMPSMVTMGITIAIITSPDNVVMMTVDNLLGEIEGNVIISSNIPMSSMKLILVPEV